MKITVKQKGRTTITISKDMRDKLMYLKIKTQAKDLNEVLESLTK